MCQNRPEMGTTRVGSGRHYERLMSPTSWIRVLTFNPLDKTHLSDCSLKSYDLNSCPPYIALSYEWGEIEPQVEIMINGVPSLIRHNLSLFLGVLQVKMKQKTLSEDLGIWIDAICIDQEDLCERNAQVSIMGQIYQRATLVLAWLGWPHGWDPKLTFRFIEEAFWSLPASEGSPEVSANKCIFLGRKYDEMLQMVLQMCRCRYWSRRWIVQEVLLARRITIMCGHHDLSWISLCLFVQRLAASRASHGLPLMEDLNKSIPFIMSCCEYGAANDKQRVPTIRQLLITFCGMDCGAWHDKVYSLLSLASDGARIPVDYGCLPQNLLCKVITQTGWSNNELQLLAEDLGILELLPSRFRHSEQLKDFNSEFSSIEEKFVVTHQILFCSISLSLTDRDLGNWREIVGDEARSTEPGRRLMEISMFFESAEQRCIHGPGEFRCRGSEHDDRRRNECHETCQLLDNLDSDHIEGGPRLVICADGSVGLACPGVRAGDLLCDFIPGRKLVVRQDGEISPYLVGTALLPKTFPLTGFVMVQLRKVLELAIQEQHYNDSLQPDCSIDGSTIADILLEEERSIMSSRVQAISDLSSSLEAGHRKLKSSEFRGSVPRLNIEGSFNVWDLITLAHQQPRLISKDEP